MLKWETYNLKFGGTLDDIPEEEQEETTSSSYTIHQPFVSLSDESKRNGIVGLQPTTDNSVYSRFSSKRQRRGERRKVNEIFNKTEEEVETTNDNHINTKNDQNNYKK